jgi:hypothetical protein
MINRILVFCLLVALFASCRAVTPAQAATGRYNKCRAVR